MSNKLNKEDLNKVSGGASITEIAFYATLQPYSFIDNTKMGDPENTGNYSSKEDAYDAAKKAANLIFGAESYVKYIIYKIYSDGVEVQSGRFDR